jgi:transposase
LPLATPARPSRACLAEIGAQEVPRATKRVAVHRLALMRTSLQPRPTRPRAHSSLIGVPLADWGGIRIVLEGLRGEDSVAPSSAREGIVQNFYYCWSKDFLEAGKKRPVATARAARLGQGPASRDQRAEGVAELTLEIVCSKKA